MSKPIINEGVGVLSFLWEEEQIKIFLSRIHGHTNGRTTAEIAVKLTSQQSKFPHLHQASFNLSSTRSRTELSNLLTKRYPPVNWENILEQLCVYALEKTRQGEEVKELWTSDTVVAPGYLLFPLLPKNQPSIFFGDGATGKSYLALLLTVCVMLPWATNPLKLKTKDYSTLVLYLDWETNEDILQWRLKKLRNGMGFDDLPLTYRRCHFPLADDIEQIQSVVVEKGIKMLVVDSLAAACGAEVIKSEPALRFFNALRQLKVTSLIVGHISKDPEAKTIYGSAFFGNYARNVWEVRKSQEIGEDELSVALFHRKANEDKLHHPLGFRWSFGEGSVTVLPEDVATREAFRSQLSNKYRVLQLLKEQPKQTVKEIAEELNLSQGNVREYLGRLGDKVVKLGDKWALRAKED